METSKELKNADTLMAASCILTGASVVYTIYSVFKFSKILKEYIDIRKSL